MKSYVVLSGNIGVGKTTLVQLMTERLGWQAYFEPVAENPYLEDFYREMGRWAFHSQLFFLTHRARSHRMLMENAQPVVQDRSLYEDAEIFAQALHLQGSMSNRDWETYHGLYQTLTALLTPPDLVVYLRASVPTLRKRIERRGREFEQGVTDDYLAQINALYENWIAGFTLAPVLVVPTDRIDFVEEPATLDAILATVLESLRGEQGSLFPEPP